MTTDTALQPMSSGAEESQAIVLKTLEACVCGGVCKMYDVNVQYIIYDCCQYTLKINHNTK